MRILAKLYQEYYQTYNGAIPQEKIVIFQRECDSAFRGLKDMYKDALISLMIGSNYKPANDRLFWDCLMPQELETQLWFKLKLAAYEVKESPSQHAEYLSYPLPASYQPYRLSDLQDFISKLGPKHFSASASSSGNRPDEEDTLGSMLYFRVLMMIGNYSEACRVIAKLQDFRI